MKYAAAYLLVRNACATTVRRIPSLGVRRAESMCTDVPTVGGILARGERRLPGAQTHPDDADALLAFASHAGCRPNPRDARVLRANARVRVSSY